jgi:hypothetical protein
LCERRADHDELGGCDAHGGIAQKTAAIAVDYFVDYFRHFISLQLELTQSC